MATLAEAISILDKLAKELRWRRLDVEAMECAYRGDHNLQFASTDFSNFFEKRYEKFSDNWCGIVADAPHERLEITGVRLHDQEKGDQGLWDIWRRNDADVFSDLAFLDAIIAKRAYALVWGDANDEPSITWEHPSQAIVSYDPETRARVAGAKVWADDDLEYATLYLPNEVWKFERARLSTALTRPSGLYVPALDGGWKPRGDKPVIPNPMGQVPLVEFANRPRLIGEPFSDISGTLSMQNAINLLWSYLFAAADEATLGQRVIIGGEMPTVPVLNEDGEEVGTRPIDLAAFSRKRALWLEDPASKIDQWDAAKLDVYTNIIEIAVGHIAAQTRTPAHYLMIGDVANVSEGAMKALETGLVKRTQEKTQHFGRAARDVFELVALSQDDKAKAEAVRGGKVLWRDVENRSDAQLADALQKKSAIGYPLEYVLELDGLPPQEIERVMRMARDQASDPTLQAILKEAAAANAGATANADPNAAPGA